MQFCRLRNAVKASIHFPDNIGPLNGLYSFWGDEYADILRSSLDFGERTQAYLTSLGDDISSSDEEIQEEIDDLDCLFEVELDTLPEKNRPQAPARPVQL